MNRIWSSLKVFDRWMCIYSYRKCNTPTAIYKWQKPIQYESLNKELAQLQVKFTWTWQLLCQVATEFNSCFISGVRIITCNINESNGWHTIYILLYFQWRKMEKRKWIMKPMHNGDCRRYLGVSLRQKWLFYSSRDHHICAKTQIFTVITLAYRIWLWWIFRIVQNCS